MDPLNEISDNNSDRYLRHEAEMWELDCLVEQELRAQQMQEDFGLEVDVGQLVDSYNGWFAMEQGVLPCTPPDRKPLLSSNNFCTASSESASPLSSRESTSEPSSSSFAESSPSRESTPELSPTPMRTRKSTRSYTNRRTPQKKTKSKVGVNLALFTGSEFHPDQSFQKSSTSLSSRINESSLSSLPPGASWDADGKARCGIDGCTQKCHSIADLRRHRESLAHCRLKQHACPGCPMRFTREDALKRHFNHRGAARCRDPDMTALRDEFLETEEAQEAQSEGKPDRVDCALQGVSWDERGIVEEKEKKMLD
ncbi:hypothetical protein C8R45DRAFT_1210625 [Mycena sanguinolenta]|nr:hypothetical protein C8R45DRAFT_1210625 [Mycena sanguinolenta]